MQLLVGLGNPGPKYERNRHSIGFMAVDAIVRHHRFGAWRARFQGLGADGEIAGAKVLALKPLTYMNESGRAVGAALRFYKLAPRDVTVIHDEMDLLPFKVKVKTGGGSAGHNGIRSIEAHIGPDFRRVRIGVGHPGERDRVLGHVLDDFTKAEAPDLETLLDAVADGAKLLAQGDDSAFMSRVALLTRPPRAKPDAAGPGGPAKTKRDGD